MEQTLLVITLKKYFYLPQFFSIKSFLPDPFLYIL